ncbi:DUF4274 domain-containing protein [Hymenobacter wooponensis]|uniref:DUF4274 domain-containing protein n=1 Tax=Hymenobacter wooponensis TaxID=1525360 RepID=A0A4Z0MLX0_9BACT|nr:DUF4274 domain-containing protein [Hymenobacter wooponensis]TGD80288.1 DUF4274 domain-containing protein [Hymenobacter wooponensis]
MDYSVSEERAQLLADKLFQFSFEEREPDKEFFDSLTNPVELHLIAGVYNWDDGMEVLLWIIDNPICDKATAAMIFWHAQPSYYTEFATEQEATYDADVYRLLRKIMTNWEVGFYRTNLISYDPRQDVKAEPIDSTYPNPKWSIPDYIKQPQVGQFPVELY